MSRKSLVRPGVSISGGKSDCNGSNAFVHRTSQRWTSLLSSLAIFMARQHFRRAVFACTAFLFNHMRCLSASAVIAFGFSDQNAEDLLVPGKVRRLLHPYLAKALAAKRHA